ncbi:MAG: hypothetical protein LAO19_16665 [Acidobacteriia bacterium]|nr:hypothetical protein [Terriglobia bacterium]
MFESVIRNQHGRGTAEEKLWRAVIAKTLEEWVRGPLRYSRIAEEFLFDNDRDFRAVCSSAGVDPSHLRKRLVSIRARGIQKEAVVLRNRGNKKPNPPNEIRNQGMLRQQAFGV